MKSAKILSLAALVALAAPAADASLVLYSSSFAGSSGTNLNGTAVTTSGATGAQHTQYGTSASATWSATTNFKANGSFDHTTTSGTTQSFSGTLAFTPQNGYVYQLTMTTDVDFTPSKQVGWFASGFFENLGYTGAATTAAGGANVWMLTRPGDTAVGFLDQVAHYNVNAGTGSQTFDPLAEDTSAPSTVTIVLDTTGGTGNWSAQYYVGNTLAASVADLGAVTINSVGIAANLREDNPGRFQTFELSVIPEPSATLLGGLGFLALLRRRR